MPTIKLHMMTSIRIIALLLLLLSSACNFPGIPGEEAESEQDENLIDTQIAQTLEAQDTLTAQAADVQVAPTDTATFLATAALSDTPTNTLIPATITLTPTTGQPIIRADIDTNCRMGPSKLYPVMGYLLVGQESSVHGRNSDSTWWYIETPKKPGTFCWAWGSSTRVEGDTSMLPVITPPPPPTLTPTSGVITILASFSNVHNCGGTPVAIFQITNTGSLPIESVSLVIENRTTDTTVYSASSNSPFLGGPGGCPPGASALGPGATAYVGGVIGIIPPGTNMGAVAKLCSENNLNGYCLTYNFTWSLP